MKILSILFTLIIALFGCNESQNSNKLDSDDCENQKERIEILSAEIKSASAFQDAEFELFNVNGFSNSRTSVPGASSWDYIFAIKVLPNDIDKWTAGMRKVTLKVDLSRTFKITEKRKENWKTTGHPEFFVDDNRTIILFRNEGIIFKHITNL